MAEHSPAEIRLDSPFGPLIVVEEGCAITAVRWGARPVESAAAPVRTPLLQEAPRRSVPISAIRIYACNRHKL